MEKDKLRPVKFKAYDKENGEHWVDAWFHGWISTGDGDFAAIVELPDGTIQQRSEIKFTDR